VEEEMQQKKVVEERARASFETGKALYDQDKFEEAVDVFRAVLKRAKGDEAKKTQFYLGESLFSAKDFASSTLTFSEFIKSHPKDSLVPTAIYRQAQAFRSLGKPKEAKLFYQELIERFPKSPLASKAKAEQRKLR
jgi:TolA-binding protein